MKKVFLLCCLVLCSCSSVHQKYFTYSSNESFTPNKFKIYVKDVKVKLSENRAWAADALQSSKHPNEKQLEEIFKEAITQQLKQDGLYSESENGQDVFKCEFYFDYVREFMAFTTDKYAGSKLKTYMIKVYKDEKLLATKQNHDTYFVNQGFWRNLTKIGKTITLAYNENDEKVEAAIFARSIANDLTRLGH